MERYINSKSRWLLLAGLMVVGLGLFAGVTTADKTADGATTASTESAGQNKYGLTEPWKTDFKPALDAAQKAGRPSVIMFSASWCPPCKMMKSEVFPKPEVQTALKGWEAVYVDVDEQEDFSKQYDITGMPTFVFLDASGKEVNRISGGMPAGEFVSKLAAHRDYATKFPGLLKQAEAEPQNAAVRKQMGDILIELGKYNDAQTQYASAVKLDPQNQTGVHADDLFVRGALLATSDTQQSARLLEQVQAKYPESPRASESLFIRGLLMLEQDDHAAGLKLFKEYAAKYPQGKYADAVREISMQLAARLGESDASTTSTTPR